MDLRRDALAGAARIVLAVREEALRRPGATGNVGMISAQPGGSNVVPGLSELMIDIRAPSDQELAELDAAVRSPDGSDRARGGPGSRRSSPTYRIPAAPMDPALVDAVEHAATEEGARSHAHAERRGPRRDGDGSARAERR